MGSAPNIEDPLVVEYYRAGWPVPFEAGRLVGERDHAEALAEDRARTEAIANSLSDPVQHQVGIHYIDNIGWWQPYCIECSDREGHWVISCEKWQRKVPEHLAAAGWSVTEG